MADKIGKPVSQRQLRVGEMIKQSLSMIFIRNEAKVPNLETNTITVTEVKMTADLKKAKVFIVPLSGKDSDIIFEKLNIIAPKIQGKIGRSLGLRFTPEIIFKKDSSFETIDKIEKLLSDIKKNK